jgi:RNA polymerase sigma factor (sigma-70 family)
MAANGDYAMNDEPNTGSFPTTQWTLIVHAIQKGDHAVAETALNRFCERYRPAIVNFFLRRTGKPDQAEDYAHEFFLTKVHKLWEDRSGFLFNARQDRTKRFRSFLATALHFFLIDQWRKGKTPALGASGDDPPVSESGDSAGEREESEKIQQEVDRSLAVQTIRDAIKKAQPSSHHIKFFNGEISQKEAAAALNQSEDAFTQSYKRFRERLRDELRHAVAEMIDDKEDIDSEIKYFLLIFSRSTASLSDAESRINK